MDSVIEKLALVSSKVGGEEGVAAVAAAAAAATTDNEATAEWSVISMIQERLFCCVLFLDDTVPPCYCVRLYSLAGPIFKFVVSGV